MSSFIIFSLPLVLIFLGKFEGNLVVQQTDRQTDSRKEARTDIHSFILYQFLLLPYVSAFAKVIVTQLIMYMKNDNLNPSIRMILLK